MFFLTKFIADVYSNNEVSNDALMLFKNDVKYRFGDDLYNDVSVINNRIFSLISELDFEKLFISYISNESIFYRFKLKNSPYEFKWEVFLDGEDGCESAVHIYKDSLKQKSTFGSIDYVYGVITGILFNNGQDMQIPFETFWEYKAERFDYEY